MVNASYVSPQALLNFLRRKKCYEAVLAAQERILRATMEIGISNTISGTSGRLLPPIYELFAHNDLTNSQKLRFGCHVTWQIDARFQRLESWVHSVNPWFAETPRLIVDVAGSVAAVLFSVPDL